MEGEEVTNGAAPDKKQKEEFKVRRITVIDLLKMEVVLDFYNLNA